jgi:hypothetical protein
MNLRFIKNVSAYSRPIGICHFTVFYYPVLLLKGTIIFSIIFKFLPVYNKLRANYTDRAAAAGRRS